MPIKQMYRGNFKIDPSLHPAVARAYASATMTTEQIARNYNISTRQVQRIAKKYHVIRSQAEANKISAPLKKYRKIPIEFRVKRKTLSLRLRYELLTAHPFCTICGLPANASIRLEIDHIDNNPMNNERSNLQVLCQHCNTGKSHHDRFS